ncbi:AbiJ-NTD4 domain-containing protein [Mesorhizobium carmichaelinearum]|uniref:AbiJ-NTD4 domain-containing protein n=1 Tax=Mesorhizobium carmichaelinearum TaxID=1208188 RepID=UPI000BA4DD48|nr:hypothetical protein [Mesorhizobium carmichaelinearum]
MNEPFSERHGYSGPDAEITIREDAPENLRFAVVQIGYGAGKGWKWIREVVCGVLFEMPNSNNWSESNVRNEVLGLVADCPWFKVYDIAEAIWRELDPDFESQDRYREELNRFFREKGIGWKLEEHKGLVFRGHEGFASVTAKAVEVLALSDRSTAANEIREALADLSRRPDPDRTGAIQHAIAALEATARHITGQPKLNLGQLVNELNIPKPLDQAVEKLWGFGSQYGRHLREGEMPRDDEAELVVSVACAVCIFLVGRTS